LRASSTTWSPCSTSSAANGRSCSARAAAARRRCSSPPPIPSAPARWCSSTQPPVSGRPTTIPKGTQTRTLRRSWRRAETGGEPVRCSIVGFPAWPVTPGSHAGSHAANACRIRRRLPLGAIAQTSTLTCVISWGRFGCRRWCLFAPARRAPSRVGTSPSTSTAPATSNSLAKTTCSLWATRDRSWTPSRSSSPPASSP
jgi:hypothetical protein